MDKPKSPQEALIENRENLLRYLVAMASDPKRASKEEAEKTFSFLRDTEKDLEKYRRDVRYAGSQKPIIYVLRYLESENKAKTLEELADELVDGGFQIGDDRASAKSNALRSLGSYFGEGRHARSNILRQAKNGLIGPYSWPDEKFTR